MDNKTHYTNEDLKDNFFTGIETDAPVNYQELLESCRIDPMAEYAEDVVCLEIVSDNGNATIGTLGNFSLFKGKAKSRKTFFMVLALTVAICRNILMNKIKGTLPQNQNVALLFDTEQSKHHAQKTVKRVCKLVGIDVPDNFKAYGLRKYPPVERLAAIEYAIYNTPNLGFVVIDGIRDLITAINDEAEATMIVSKLMKWTEEKNIHIVCVLHENKGDSNARGHVGSEMTNKAESVISIAKDSVDKNISIVSAEYCRDKDFESFAFCVDENELPQIVKDWTILGKVLKPEKNTIVKEKQMTVYDLSDQIHDFILSDAFKADAKPKYAALKIQLKLAAKKHIPSFSDNQVQELIVWYQNENKIIQVGTVKTKNSHYEKYIE